MTSRKECVECALVLLCSSKLAFCCQDLIDFCWQQVELIDNAGCWWITIYVGREISASFSHLGTGVAGCVQIGVSQFAPGAKKDFHDVSIKKSPKGFGDFHQISHSLIL